MPFLAADCRFNLGRYDEALQLYDCLAKRFVGRTEGLNALGGAGPLPVGDEGQREAERAPDRD